MTPYYNNNQGQMSGGQPSNWNRPTAGGYGYRDMSGMSTGYPQDQYPASTPPPPPARTASYIPGRVIVSEDEIRPNEVCPDGTPTVFPMADRQRIIVKEVNPEGRIVPSIYELVTNENKDPKTQMDIGDQLTMIMDRLDGLEKAIKRNRYYKAKPSQKGD